MYIFSKLYIYYLIFLPFLWPCIFQNKCIHFFTLYITCTYFFLFWIKCFKRFINSVESSSNFCPPNNLFLLIKCVTICLHWCVLMRICVKKLFYLFFSQDSAPDMMTASAFNQKQKIHFAKWFNTGNQSLGKHTNYAHSLFDGWLAEGADGSKCWICFIQGESLWQNAPSDSHALLPTPSCQSLASRSRWRPVPTSHILLLYQIYLMFHNSNKISQGS